MRLFTGCMPRRALAAKAGVTVPEWRMEVVGEQAVLLLRRFDRVGAIQIPFLFALSMLDASDHETRISLEIVDALRQQGAAANLGMRSSGAASFRTSCSPTPTTISAITDFSKPSPMIGAPRRPTTSIRSPWMSDPVSWPRPLISTTARHPSNYDALFGDHSNVLQSSATTPPATAASAAPPP